MKAGSIVMCINDTWDDDIFELHDTLPVKYGIYTIRKIFTNIEKAGGPPGVALEGIYGHIINYRAYWGEEVIIECHFRIARFKEILPPIGEDLALKEVNSLENKNEVYGKQKGSQTPCILEEK